MKPTARRAPKTNRPPAADRGAGAPADPSSAAVRVDAEAECIWRGEEKIGVPPKAFAVLRRLMERPQHLVTKSDLLEAVWPDVHVTEIVLNKAVRQLRIALGDDSKRPSFIETVHRRGFRWIGPAAAAPAAAPAAAIVTEISLDAGDTTIVGREASLAQLARCYALAASGQRQFVLIGGEPGIGKTALVDEFVNRLAKQHPEVRVARGQCIESYGAGDLYRPLHETVEQLVRHGGEDTRAIFLKCAPSWLLALPELLSPAEGELLRRTVILPTGHSVERELERAIEAASEASAIVLILEDLHWSEPATVAVLSALASRRQPARLLLLGTYRSVDAIVQQHPIIRLKRELSAKKRCVAIDLEGLPADAIVDLLDRRYPNHDAPADFAARLLAHSSGNPLFLLNALADFEARGWLHRDDGRWRCSADLDAIAAAIPESTRELIALRLDQLPPATRELLEVASVAGNVFATQTVALAAQRPADEVEVELDGLAQAGLFLERGAEVEWPDGSRGYEHRFRHALYQQVARRNIPPSRRPRLHGDIALALEKGYGARAAEIAGPLSWHHEHAGNALRAVDYLELLVQQAYARSASHEAEPMLAHAVALLKRTAATPERDQRLLAMTTAHGIALGATRGVTSPEALRALQESRALAQTLPTAVEQIVARGGMVAGKIMAGELRQARILAEEILALAGANPLARMTAHVAVGTSALHLGQIDIALQNLQQAVAAIDATAAAPMQGYDPSVPAHAYLGWARIVAGHPEQGRDSIESALRIARVNDVPWYLAATLNMAAFVAVIRRDFAATRELAHAALAYGAEKDLLLWNEANQVRLGWCDVMESGDPRRLAALREFADAFRQRGQITASYHYCALADACLRAGRLDQAASALDAAFDTRGEGRLFDAELMRVRGALSAAHASESGASLEDARECFERAIEIARAQGTRLFGLRATLELCRLPAPPAERRRLHERLREIVDGFEEGLGECDLRQARAALDHVGG